MSSSTGTSRVVALVDMDCFYVQVEERDNPSIKGKPAAVVQYKAYKGGGIIAVNYEARAKGVTRNMRGDDAKAICPEIILVRVPETRGKADLTKYRDAGREVIQVLTNFSSCVERASIDEAYIDLSEAVEERLKSFSEQDLFSVPTDIVKSLAVKDLKNNFVLGFDSTESWLDMIRDSEMAPMDDIKLAVGAEIVGKMREAVFQKTSFRCSAGIAHNKVLAKLVCGINKPNKQTVLPHGSVPELWSGTKVKKVRNLGGKLGDFLVEKLQCEMMSNLLKFTEKELGIHLGSKTGSWIFQLARGYDDEPVNPRQLPKSIGCNKNFPGKEALLAKDRVKFWINQLSAEVVERIQKDYEMNNRRAKTLTLHLKFEGHNALSRSCGVHAKYNPERIATEAYSMMDKLYQNFGVLPVTMLGLIASKFEDELDTSGYAKINNFFAPGETAVETKPSSTETASNAVAQLTPIVESEPKASSSSTKAKSKNQVLPESLVKIDTKSDTTASASVINVEKEDSNSSEKEPPKRKPFFVFSDPDRDNRLLAKVAKEKGLPMPPLHSPKKQVPPLVIPTNSLPYDRLQECERCKKIVPLLEYVAHMDNHFARDLSREINGLPPLGFDLRPETLEAKERAKEKLEKEQSLLNKQSTSGKRPRGAGGGTANSRSTTKRGRKANTTPVKTIDSYFKKQ